MEFIAKFCPGNSEEDLYELKDHLKQLSNVDVVEDRCLNYCGQCLVQPFTLINGKNIVGNTVDELLANIVEHIEVEK
ncbi:DUF1450 domain-containing protein [Ectobacillus panaciterrae]|uniref:DUF1450 domain-containing protein n=1 Tax=Ectobacillus panaciterrae TaxID=363872 RepID=UPI000417B6C8|nr:DUF1450 domain-containing protein [Ectobacillus panaciterrae]